MGKSFRRNTIDGFKKIKKIEKNKKTRRDNKILKNDYLREDYKKDN